MLSLYPTKRLSEAMRSLAELSEEFHGLEARRGSLPAEECWRRWNETVLARSRALLPPLRYRPFRPSTGTQRSSRLGSEVAFDPEG
jgi:hypothetical protein